MGTFELTNEILALAILTAITVVGYMIAINARGVTRMSLSYLLATVLLAVDVLAIVQYVNGRASVAMEQEYNNRLAREKAEMEKKLAENSVDKEVLREQELKNDEILKVQAVVSEASKLANSLAATNLLDYTLTYDQKVSRSARLKREAQQIKSKYKALEPKLVYVKNGSISQAMDKLAKSALYYKLYYSAEDSDQEVVREGVMRSNAKGAKDLLRTISSDLERMKK